MAGFLSAAIVPDYSGQASLRQLHDLYPIWCSERGTDMLAPDRLGNEMRAIFEALGLHYEHTDSDVVVRGARVAPKQITGQP